MSCSPNRPNAYCYAGRIPQALAACRALLERPHDQRVAGSVRICLGHALLAQGQVRDALAELQRAGGSRLLPPGQRAAAAAWEGFARLSLGDLDGAAAAAQAAELAATAAGDHHTVSIALATAARVAEARGHLTQALARIEDAVRRADASPGRLGHRYPVQVTRGHILIDLDQLDDATAALGAGLRSSEELGVRWALASSQVFVALARFMAGDWDDAVAELETSLELAAESGETYNRVYAHGLLSLISFHRNDLSGARAAAAAAGRDLADWDPGYRMTWAVWPRALIQEARGGPGPALATITEVWDRCASSGLVLGYPLIGPDLVRIALAAGDAGRADAACAAVAAVAADNDVAWMTGAALRCQGLAADDPEILQAAAAAYARGSRPLGHALACHDAGAAWLRRQHADRARPLLDQAIGIYERLGAARGRASADAVLRAAGMRRGRSGARGRPRSVWLSLTPAERAVAGLVAEGLSNPQIGEQLYISRRTVQTHLAHVFAKLDLSTRAQLAAEVTQHRASQP